MDCMRCSFCKVTNCALDNWVACQNKKVLVTDKIIIQFRKVWTRQYGENQIPDPPSKDEILKDLEKIRDFAGRKMLVLFNYLNERGEVEDIFVRSHFPRLYTPALVLACPFYSQLPNNERAKEIPDWAKEMPTFYTNMGKFVGLSKS